MPCLGQHVLGCARSKTWPWLLLLLSFMSIGTVLSGSLAGNGVSGHVVIPPEARKVYPYFVSSAIRELHEQLFQDVFKVILDEGIFFNDNKSRALPPFQFKTKSELREIIDFTLPQTRTSHEDLLKIIQNVVRYSPHPSHPYKVDRHGTGLDPYGLVGEWIASILSLPLVTYFIAPVFTLMEFEVQKRIRLLVYGAESGDGMMVPGTAMGSGYALQIAIQQKFPDLKTKGFVAINNPRPVMFVSDHGSFFYEKYAIWEGIGMYSVVRVATDPLGRMNVDDLKLKIEQAKLNGQTPVMVVGTAGTPILGAIDPLDQIATVASENQLWFHVQGFLAGSLFLSEKHRSRIAGFERSDSFLWSADVGLAAPFVSTILVTRKEGVIHSTFTFGASVLFAPSPFYNNSAWDKGDTTLQCTRRPDVYKIWFMWKAKGEESLAQHINYILDMKNYAVLQIQKKSTSFQLVLPDFESHQVSFYYTPSSLRQHSRHIQHAILAHSKYTEHLKAVLLTKGILQISVNKFPNSKDGLQFFVMNLGNSVLTPKDVDYILDQIEHEGELIQLSNKVISDAIALEYIDCKTGKQNLCNQFPEVLSSASVRNETKSSDDVNSKVDSSIEIPPAPLTPATWVSAPIKSLHKQFMVDVLKLALDEGTFYETKRHTPPIHFVTPEVLMTMFDFSLSNHSGSMEKNPEELLEILRNTIKYSARVQHPYYSYHLAQGVDPYTSIADFVISVVNSQMTTYEDNPAFTIMQEEVVKAVGREIGFPDNCEGLVLPGGSAGNQIAVHSALLRKYPSVKGGGLAAGVNKSNVVFLSVGAHYSTNKGVFFQGLGLENAVYVNMDERGRMSIPDLKAKIQEAYNAGKVPLLVVATAGTTVIGAMDPVFEIADICREHKMWLHIDGSYGGSGIMTSNLERKKRQFRGIERADSFTFNPHKIFVSAKETTVTIIKESGFLDRIGPIPSEQEFNNEILYKSTEDDLGRRQFFPDRRENIFKFWLLWKAKGFEGLCQHIDYGYNLTQTVFEYIKTERSDCFILAHPHFAPESVNVNIYYIPKRYRTRTDRQAITFWNEINHIQIEIMKLLLADGRVSIAAEPVDNWPAFFILSLHNSAFTFEDAKYILDIIDFYGKDM